MTTSEQEIISDIKAIVLSEIKDEVIITIKGKTREAIKDIVKEVVDSGYRKDMIKEVKQFIHVTARDFILEEINKIDPPKIIVDRFEKLQEKNFEPIVKSIYQNLLAHITTKLEKTITQKINLNTSELRILNDDIRMSYLSEIQLRNRGLVVRDGKIMEVEGLQRITTSKTTSKK